MIGLLARLGLPSGLPQLREVAGVALAGSELVAAMRLDKKNRSGELHLVLPRAPGRIEQAVPADGALVQSWLG